MKRCGTHSLAPFCQVTSKTASTMAASLSTIAPPIADQRPHMVAFGHVDGETRVPEGRTAINPPRFREDPWFWLRDDTRWAVVVLSVSCSALCSADYQLRTWANATCTTKIKGDHEWHGYHPLRHSLTTATRCTHGDGRTDATSTHQHTQTRARARAHTHTHTHTATLRNHNKASHTHPPLTVCGPHRHVHPLRRKSEEILAHLRRENEYGAHTTKALDPLRAVLYDEHKGHLKETDEVRRGGGGGGGQCGNGNVGTMV
jgi:hypothetical protein